MANEGFMLAALGGLALFALFRKPGGAPGAPPPNGGQVASLYGGGSLGDFAAAATIRADESSGVGKGFLLEPAQGLQSKAAGALGSGGMGAITAPVTINLTTVPMLGVGALGDYVEVPLDMPPGSTTQDEDIGQAPWTAAGLMFGGSNSDAAATSITLPPSSVPVMNQTVFEVDIASIGHVSETIKPTQEQPGMTANVRTAPIDYGSGALDDFIRSAPVDPFVRTPQIDTGSGALDDFIRSAPVDPSPAIVQVDTSVPSVIPEMPAYRPAAPEVPRYQAVSQGTPPPPPRSTARYMLF